MNEQHRYEPNVGRYVLETVTRFTEPSTVDGWYRTFECQPQTVEVGLYRNNISVPYMLVARVHGVIVGVRSRLPWSRVCKDLGKEGQYTVFMGMNRGIDRRVHLHSEWMWLAGNEETWTRIAINDMLSDYAHRGRRLPRCYARMLDAKWVQKHVSPELWDRVKPEVLVDAK